MSEADSIATELIVTGFHDTQTAFLARAAIAKMQSELEMAMDEVATVTRGKEGSISVQQSLNRDATKNEVSEFWETLSDLLFAFDSPTEKTTEATCRKCVSAGITPTNMCRVSSTLRESSSAIFVRVKDLTQHEKICGLLQGFRGEFTQISLGA